MDRSRSHRPPHPLSPQPRVGGWQEAHQSLLPGSRTPVLFLDNRRRLEAPLWPVSIPPKPATRRHDGSLHATERACSRRRSKLPLPATSTYPRSIGHALAPLEHPRSIWSGPSWERRLWRVGAGERVVVQAARSPSAEMHRSHASPPSHEPRTAGTRAPMGKNSSPPTRMVPDHEPLLCASQGPLPASLPVALLAGAAPASQGSSRLIAQGSLPPRHGGIHSHCP
jgi:hypothetical protein